MKSKLFVSAIIAVLMAAASLGDDAAVDYAVATVDGVAITRSQVERRRQMLGAQPPFNNSNAPEFEAVVELEIERRLVISAAGRDLDPRALTYLRARAGELASNSRDPRKFDAGAGGSKTVELYYQDLLIGAYLQQKVYGGVSVTPAELRTYYQQNIDRYSMSGSVTIREILVRQGQRTPEEARAVAETAAGRLAAGEDFAVVAEEVSEGPYADSGGLWPPKRAAEFIPQVRAALEGLEVGAASAPFESPLGRHIVKIEERTAESRRPFEEVQGEIYGELLNAARNRARNAAMSDLKSKAVIKR